MKIIVVGKNESLKEFTLVQGENIIGRRDVDEGVEPTIDLELYDSESKVSRQHASVTLKGGIAVLEDIGSLNGTFLVRDKKKLAPGEKATIHIGDQFLVGSILLRLEK